MTQRLAVLGCGWVADMHVRAAAACGVPVVGVANHRLESAERFAKEHGIARVTTDWRALIAEPEVDAVIAAWTRHHTKQEAMQLIGAAGIPAGAVLDTMELQNDPSFEQRGIMQVMHHPVHGDFKVPAWPVRVDGKPSRVAPSPVLGEHTADVLGSWLGLNEADVAALRRDGAL